MPTLSDRDDFVGVGAALGTLGFGEDEARAAWRVVAAIIHLGDVAFQEDDDRWGVGEGLEIKLIFEGGLRIIILGTGF